MVKNLLRTASGAAASGLVTTIKYLRGAAGTGLGTTTKYLQPQQSYGWAPRSSTCDAQRDCGLDITIE
jgi:hypothetical protein